MARHVRSRPDPERLVSTFCRLAGVDSPSRHERALAAYLVAEMERLGWTVADDGSGPDCGNVIASLAGDEALEPLLFTSHMDVVTPCLGVQPHLENGLLRSGGDTVLGADAKASVAALLEVAEVLAGAPVFVRRPPLEVVFTWGEEIGHLGAKALDMSLLRARRAYVLDGLVPVGTIIIAAPAYYAWSVRVVGRAAHAGVEPERGISAIAVAAQALTQLPWGRLDESTTANVGTIQGGSGRNAVPAEVRLEGEVRSHANERAAAVVHAIQETFESVARQAGGRADVHIQQLYSGYELDPQDDVVALASRAFASVDVDGVSTPVRSGGGSDANEFNARGVRACVLGIGAQACHSVDEHITVSELQRLTDWTLNIISLASADSPVED